MLMGTSQLTDFMYRACHYCDTPPHNVTERVLERTPTQPWLVLRGARRYWLFPA